MCQVRKPRGLSVLNSLLRNIKLTYLVPLSGIRLKMTVGSARFKNISENGFDCLHIPWSKQTEVALLARHRLCTTMNTTKISTYKSHWLRNPLEY